MRIEKATYNFLILAIAFLVIGGGILFKLKTESLISISDAAKKEVSKYKIQKRKYDLTIQSLKMSSANYDELSLQLFNELDSLNKGELDDFLSILRKVEQDSILLLITEKIHEYGDFYEIIKTRHGTKSYMYKNKCEKPVVFEFIQQNSGERKLVAIYNTYEFLKCSF